MEVGRLVRVLRDRWLVVALIAAIGFVSAFWFTQLSSGTPEETWEALIPLRFDLEEGETVDDLSSRIQDALGVALLATEGLMAENPGSTIFADTASGRLFFRSVGSSEEEAVQQARALILSYLGSDQVGGDISSELQSLATQAELLAQEISAKQRTFTAEEEELLRRHEILDRSIQAVVEGLIQVNVPTFGATAEDQVAADALREELNQTLTSLTAEKAALPPPPSMDLSPTEQLELGGLERQLEIVQLEYERLSLLEAGVLADNSQQEAPRVTSLSPAPPSPVRNGVIGLLGGLVFAMFALILVSRSRREIWLADDLPVPLIAEVPHRKLTTTPGPTWYDSTTGGKRKEAVQAARTAIDGALDHGPFAFAVVSDHLDADATHALAVDLATSFASAGKTVLLVDADFGHSVEMNEYSVGEPSLGSILSQPAGPDDALDSKAAAAIDDAIRVRSDFAVLPSGPSPTSPADALAGQQFRRFISMARRSFDLVIAVGGSADSASAQVLSQRLGAAVVAIRPGQTTAPRLEAALVDMSQQRVIIPGVIMVHKSESRFSLPMPSGNLVRRSPVPAKSESESVSESGTISRLSYYPFPGSKRSATGGGGSLDQLVEGLTASRLLSSEEASDPAATNGGMSESPPVTESGAQDPVADAVLDAIGRIDREKAYAPVADYVVARVEDMMTATPGQANVSREMVDVANDIGFVPLTPTGSIPTVWDRMCSELIGEVGETHGRELASSISGVLTGSDEDDQRAMDRWIEDEFFRRHLDRTEREPDVWQLGSAGGAVQVLVNGKRLTDGRLERLTTDVVRRRISDLEKELKDVRVNGEPEQAQALEEALKDVHKFEVDLSVLRGGSNPDARLVYPWRKQDRMPQGWSPIWSEGIRPNIAPLQRLGLLPVPVLTDEELNELVPAR